MQGIMSHQPQASISGEVVLYTPEMAREALKHNKSNRKVSDSTVHLYARLMREGKWVLGEVIQFDWNGDMMNGQHRMLAVIEADTPVAFIVLRGLAPEAKDSMDQHRKRTAGDVMSMHGFRDATHLASVVRVVARWDEGARGPALMGAGQFMLSPVEIMEIASKDPHLVEGTRIARTQGFALLGPTRVVGPLWVLTQRANPEASDQFFASLESGENLSAGNPILALRRYWLKENNDRRRVRPITAFSSLNAGVRAWNAWSKGEPLTKLTWKAPNVPEVNKNVTRRPKPVE